MPADDRGRIEGGHRLERLGPLEDVALYPERRARVRQGRHDEVAADDHALLGDPTQVWSSVSPSPWRQSSVRSPSDSMTPCSYDSVGG